MKTKHILILLMVVLFAFTSCSSRYDLVRITVKRHKSVDFSQYDRIIYADIELESAPEKFVPDEELQAFFLEDFPRVINRDVEHIKAADIPGKAEKRVESIKELLKDSPNSVLITGKLKFDIRALNKIKEVKNDKGKRERKFVEVQFWAMTLTMAITELKTGKELFRHEYKEKETEVEASTPKYNFESLFFKINNRFATQVSKDKKMQRRYLLK
ncbi:MAG: hypothetical protein GY757_35040 [bacterium]|nr:hypothetical protein [bacterium]